MKIIVNNVNDYSIGFKGSYFPAVSQKRVKGDINFLNQLIKKEELDVVDVEDINYNLKLEDLKTIAKIKDISYSGYTKDEVIAKLKGEYVEEEETEEEGDA